MSFFSYAVLLLGTIHWPVFIDAYEGFILLVSTKYSNPMYSGVPLIFFTLLQQILFPGEGTLTLYMSLVL